MSDTFKVSDTFRAEMAVDAEQSPTRTPDGYWAFIRETKAILIDPLTLLSATPHASGLVQLRYVPRR